MGNTCRSPMAEAYCNDRYKDKIRAESRGVYTDKSGINPLAVRALTEHGILPTDENDYTEHTSLPVSLSDVENADAVICMTRDIADLLSRVFYPYAEKIFTFNESIPDPYGGSLDDYMSCLSSIAEQTDIFIKEHYGDSL